MENLLPLSGVYRAGRAATLPGHNPKPHIMLPRFGAAKRIDQLVQEHANRQKRAAEGMESPTFTRQRQTLSKVYVQIKSNHFGKHPTEIRGINILETIQKMQRSNSVLGGVQLGGRILFLSTVTSVAAQVLMVVANVPVLTGWPLTVLVTSGFIAGFGLFNFKKYRDLQQGETPEMGQAFQGVNPHDLKKPLEALEWHYANALQVGLEELERNNLIYKWERGSTEQVRLTQAGTRLLKMAHNGELPELAEFVGIPTPEQKKEKDVTTDTSSTPSDQNKRLLVLRALLKTHAPGTTGWDVLKSVEEADKSRARLKRLFSKTIEESRLAQQNPLYHDTPAPWDELVQLGLLAKTHQKGTVRWRITEDGENALAAGNPGASNKISKEDKHALLQMEIEDIRTQQAQQTENLKTLEKEVAVVLAHVNALKVQQQKALQPQSEQQDNVQTRTKKKRRKPQQSQPVQSSPQKKEPAPVLTAQTAELLTTDLAQQEELLRILQFQVEVERAVYEETRQQMEEAIVNIQAAQFRLKINQVNTNIVNLLERFSLSNKATRQQMDTLVEHVSRDFLTSQGRLDEVRSQFDVRQRVRQALKSLQQAEQKSSGVPKSPPQPLAEVLKENTPASSTEAAANQSLAKPD